MSDLMLAYNPRRRRYQTKRRKYRRIMHNPIRIVANRRRVRTLGSSRDSGNFLSRAVPIGAGFGLGRAIPKLFNLTGFMRWLTPIGIGVLSPMVLSGFIGRKNATSFGIAMAASSVVYGLDELFFKKQGTPLLADEPKDEVELISANDVPEIPEISAEAEPEYVSDEPEYISDEPEYISDGGFEDDEED